MAPRPQRASQRPSFSTRVWPKPQSFHGMSSQIRPPPDVAQESDRLTQNLFARPSTAAQIIHDMAKFMVQTSEERNNRGMIGLEELHDLNQLSSLLLAQAFTVAPETLSETPVLDFNFVPISATVQAIRGIESFLSKWMTGHFPSLPPISTENGLLDRISDFASMLVEDHRNGIFPGTQSYSYTHGNTNAGRTNGKRAASSQAGTMRSTGPVTEELYPPQPEHPSPSTRYYPPLNHQLRTTLGPWQSTFGRRQDQDEGPSSKPRPSNLSEHRSTSQRKSGPPSIFRPPEDTVQPTQPPLTPKANRNFATNSEQEDQIKELQKMMIDLSARVEDLANSVKKSSLPEKPTTTTKYPEHVEISSSIRPEEATKHSGPSKQSSCPIKPSRAKYEDHGTARRTKANHKPRASLSSSESSEVILTSTSSSSEKVIDLKSQKFSEIRSPNDDPVASTQSMPTYETSLGSSGACRRCRLH